MRINVAIPEAHVEAPVLNAALESVTRLNEQMMANGEVPTIDKGIKHGVRWKPEPPGDEHFDHAKTVMARKWGDCDDLAPWHAATLRHTGEDPDAKAIVYRSGEKRWHAVVQRSDGSIDDPSKRAGMGASVGIAGAALPLMSTANSSVVGAYMVRPQIAIRPVRGAFQARADLPWNWKERLDEKPSAQDYAMTALHTAPLAATALTGAIDGICRLGVAAGFADPDHLNRLSAIADAVCGHNYDELAGTYGEDHANAAYSVVGTFFTSAALGEGNTLIISPGEAASSALRAMTSDSEHATDDVKKLAAIVHKHAKGDRPEADSLTGAIMRYLATTQGPVARNSADEHARLLIADQTAKRLLKDPWFQKELAKASLNGEASVEGFFDFIGKAVGAVGNAVGNVVKTVAPIVAKIAPVIPIIGPAIAGAAGLASAAANVLAPSRPAPPPEPRPAPPPPRAPIVIPRTATVAPAAAARAAPPPPVPRGPAYVPPPIVPAAPMPASPAFGSRLVPGGVPGSAAIHQGQLFHLVPFG